MNIIDFSMFAVTIFSLGVITGVAGLILIETIAYAYSKRTANAKE